MNVKLLKHAYWKARKILWEKWKMKKGGIIWWIALYVQGILDWVSNIIYALWRGGGANTKTTASYQCVVRLFLWKNFCECSIRPAIIASSTKSQFPLCGLIYFEKILALIRRDIILSVSTWAVNRYNCLSDVNVKIKRLKCETVRVYFSKYLANVNPTT